MHQEIHRHNELYLSYPFVGNDCSHRIILMTIISPPHRKNQTKSTNSSKFPEKKHISLWLEQVFVKPRHMMRRAEARQNLVEDQHHLSRSDPIWL